jgi:hypothetical protein
MSRIDLKAQAFSFSLNLLELLKGFHFIRVPLHIVEAKLLGQQKRIFYLLTSDRSKTLSRPHERHKTCQ